MNPSRFEAAVRAFDALNAEDPTLERAGGVERPRELLQAERLSAWIARLEPQASEELRLAARCQHLRRWEVKRTSYPEGRTGYLRWRKDLQHFHAETAARVLGEAGYDAARIERVRAINLKQSMKQDADVQTMEDALCLAFLEHEIEAFAEKHPPEKLVEILQKTWRKMSPRAHALALELPLRADLGALVSRAVGA